METLICKSFKSGAELIGLAALPLRLCGWGRRGSSLHYRPKPLARTPALPEIHLPTQSCYILAGPTDKNLQVNALLLKWSRFTALIFAIGLGIGEAVINWGAWQFAPLWIVDYVIVAWLLAGFYRTRSGQNLSVLISGWAFAAGVFYMALFVSLDPELRQLINPSPTIVALMVFMLGLATLGILTAAFASRKPI